MTESSRPVSRRHFIAAALSTGAVAGCVTRDPAGPAVIDTHTHFYDPSRPRGVPWPPPNDPILFRTVLPPEYERLAAPLGIGGTVVVEASPWVEDNDWLLDLAAQDRFLVGIVGHLKPGQPEFGTQLERLARHSRFRGIRTGVWDPKSGFDDAAVVRDLGLLARRGLSADLLIGPDQLPAVAALARRLPSLRIVVDHCANVRVDGKAPPGSWTEGIRECGGFSDIVMKVSGLVEGTGREQGAAPADPDFYRPVLDVLWDAFGPERVMFGSNWPVSSRCAPLATVFNIAHTYFSGRGREAMEAFFHSNALRVYGLARGQ